MNGSNMSLIELLKSKQNRINLTLFLLSDNHTVCENHIEESPSLIQNRCQLTRSVNKTYLSDTLVPDILKQEGFL